MKQLQVKPLATKQIKQGQRLVKLDDLCQPQQLADYKEGDVVAICDKAGQFLGQLLVGRQQKGIGWIYTQTKGRIFDADWVREKVQQAIQTRQSYFLDEGTTAFRLVNGEGDGLGGVTVDWYAGYLQLNWYAEGIYRYREAFVQSLVQLLPTIKGIYETKRFTQETAEQAIQHIWGEVAPRPLVIQEHRVNYAIHLGEEWMTGLFLDQRDVRDYLMQQVAGKSVLNLFSYTGAFSVAAACGGASQTVSVDVAKRSLAKTSENFGLNQIEAPSATHEIRVGDVFEYTRFALRKKLQFDWVVCDPPSFARTKKYRFSAVQDYLELAKDLCLLVAPKGCIVLSTNHSGYSMEKFRQDMLTASQGKFELIAEFRQPDDFKATKDPESQYLKVLVLQRRA